MSKRSARRELVDALYREQQQSALRAVLFHSAVAAQVGINITDVSCLGVLDKDGPMSAGQLAQRIGLTRGGAITAVVDRLEKAGFLHKRRDPDDRRRVMIEINRDSPYQALQTALDGLSGDYVALIDSYDDAQIRLLRDFASRANTVMAERTAQLVTT